MKKGYGLQLICIGVLSVCAAAHASVPEMHIVSSYEMLPDDNAITYPDTSRFGTFSMIVTDAPVSTEEIIVSEPEYLWTCNPSSGDFSFSENGTYAHMFLGDKAFGTVYTVKGEVKWEVTDTEPDPDSVSTVAASDVITLDTPLFDFTVVSDPYDGDGVGTNVMTKGVLTDNRTATVTVSALGYSNLDHIKSISFTSTQASPGTPVNKAGLGINFTQEAGDILTWKTTRTYWYGITPNKCCADNSHDYKFEMTVNGCCKTSHVYKVALPESTSYVEEEPSMKRTPNSKSETVVSAPELLLYNNTHRLYRCRIEYKDFEKSAKIYGLPVTHQYAEETAKEEHFHVAQWFGGDGVHGNVPSEQGGQGDIWTGKGIRWFASHRFLSVDYVIREDSLEALTQAREIVEYGEECEANVSDAILNHDLGLFERKAKEYAGFNAAYKYHCHYEKLYGAATPDRVHPAYQ